MKISLKGVMFFISCSIVSTTRFWGINVNNNIKYLIAGIWSLYMLAVFYLNYKSKANTLKTERRVAIIKNVKCVLIPFLVFIGYSIIIWFFRTDVIFRNYTRLFSTVLYLILAWGFVSCGYYLFGRKVIDYCFWAMVTSYILGSIIPLGLVYGPTYVIQYFFGSLLGNEMAGSYYMEVHDLTFAMGMLFLFYSFFEDKKRKNHKTKIIITFFMIVFGFKKIEILALIIAIAMYIVLMRRGKNIQYRAFLFFVVFSAGSIIYLYLIKTGMLEILTLELGMDPKNRLGYYRYAAEYFEINPGFWGLGYTYFSRLWSELYLSHFRIDNYGIAASVHSDVIVNYIELGFFVFVWWVYYLFVSRTKILKHKFGNTVAECSLLITIYGFILYLTDNTSTYFITQMINLAVPLSISLEMENSGILRRYISD